MAGVTREDDGHADIVAVQHLGVQFFRQQADVRLVQLERGMPDQGFAMHVGDPALAFGQQGGAFIAQGLDARAQRGVRLAQRAFLGHGGFQRLCCVAVLFQHHRVA